MNSRFVKLFVTHTFLLGTLIFSQNCSPGFKVMEQEIGSELASSTLSAPDIVFASAPDMVTSSNVSINFDIIGSASSVLCSLNQGPGADCSARSVTYNNLADGDYSLDVTVSSIAGTNTRRRLFRKDTTAPVVNVTMMPAASSPSTAGTFVFVATDNLSGVMNIQCSLDNTAFTVCTSPVSLSALTIGAHNFRIQARDNAGNQSAIYSYNWTVTAIGTPSVTLSGAPASLTNSQSASFSFTGQLTVSFECSIDSAAFAACTSPHVLQNVAAGAHTFRVRGVSATGVRSGDATANWIVDLLSPALPTLAASVPVVTTLTSATFTFSSTDANGIARYECSLNAGAYATCTSPRTVTGLAVGARSFSVRAIDNAGNTSAVATFNFTVNAPNPSAGPIATFTQKPINDVRMTDAIFAFSISEGATAVNLIQCSLDNAAFSTCTSPVVLQGLSAASHNFRVQIRDAGGNTNLISHTWTMASPLPTPTASGPVYYFSDCQNGAVAGCVPGNNANAGTSTGAPKQNLAGFDFNSLPAGSQLLFARGGAWNNFSVFLRNLNATPTNPLVFDSYATSWGGSTRPLMITTSGNAFSFGPINDTVVDGGYLIRNLKLDGRESATWGFILLGQTRNVTIENNEITGFEIATHFQNNGASGNLGLIIRNNLIHRNREMGMLGDAHNMIIESNIIARNNYSGSGFNHGLYISGHGTNGIVRNNQFIYNSIANGLCTGGNLTVHGQWNGLLIEGNKIVQGESNGGCYGVSVTPGYVTVEFFRNVVVRANTIVNLGGCAICMGASVGPIAENNLLVNLNNSWMSGVVLAANVQAPGIGGDDIDNGAIIRNNTMCFVSPTSDSVQVATANAGQVSVSGTIYRTGADAMTGPCAL